MNDAVSQHCADARADLSLPITIQSAKLHEANLRVTLNDAAVVSKAAKVVVPAWRPKSYTVSYRLEGIEDLTDDAYEQRHSKHEYDEKLIKKWDMRRQREEYERRKLLKGRHEASYLQPPRVQNKNKKQPKADDQPAAAVASNGSELVSLESLLQRALDVQYIEILDAKAEALLLDQMSDIASKLKEAVKTATPVAEKPPTEKTPSLSRGRRTKEIQENKPPIEAATAADLNKSKASVVAIAKETAAQTAALQTNTNKSNDNSSNIIIKTATATTRKLLKSPVKSYPIIGPLWSASESPSTKSNKSSVLSTSYSAEPVRAKRARKPSDATGGGSGFVLATPDHKNCSSGSSIYDDIDLDFRKLGDDDTTTTASSHIMSMNHHSAVSALRQRPTTRSRSSSRSLSIDHHFGAADGGDNSNGHSSVSSSSTGLQAVPTQQPQRKRPRARKDERDSSSPTPVASSSFAKQQRSTKRIRMN